jgi:hypothetical protein
MFPIMKLLCTEETVDLIRNCGVRVIPVYSQKGEWHVRRCRTFASHSPEIRSDFVVCRREQAARRPPGNIHDLKPSCHLRHLHWVDGAERMYWLAFLGSSVEHGIKLVGKQCGRKGQRWKRSLLRSNGSRRVRTRQTRESWLGKESLDGSHAGDESLRLFWGCGRVQGQCSRACISGR